MDQEPPEYHYVAYIDEAGDPGLRKVKPIDDDGSSEWLILSGVVMRKKWEPDVAQWMNSLKSELGVDRKGPLHFRNLSPSRRLGVAKHVANLPIRGFVVCSNKKNMRKYRNPNAEKVPSQEWFYNWCVRLLLERMTAYCDGRSAKDFDGQKCKMKIEFSRRGGHRYSQTKAYSRYLRHQEQAGSLYLTKRQIVTDMLHTDLMEHHAHWSKPGLQLADVLASAFYASANTIGPGIWDAEPAKALQKIMATEDQIRADFGVALQPTPPWKGELTIEQQHIFEFYGYDFAKW